ncbi:DUF4376 domain-containing protein [Magnetospirillum aberrantis]|uniref:DUF4376 domain-containing protein n=1 Tax=Magnetospirillum aberrantis SpK TaxID=908842 RepID=A0A7C9UU17_9PROT|nr:DUF4376 domain-containing protein [Magnetospirillum aberrantis]NFV79986.1 DUF4376 domain-containing protein [Magnetospirillum aberrantis SpK]
MSAIYYKDGLYFSDIDTVEISGVARRIGAMTAEQRVNAGYEVVDIDTRPDLDDVAIITEVKDGARISYTVTPRPLEQVKEMSKAKVAEYRYGIETGGLTVAGVAIPTDDRTKVLLNGAYSRAIAGDPSAVRKFKTPSGFLDATNEQIIAMAEAIADHVQACFNAEAAHCAAIDAMEDDVDDPIAARKAIIGYDYTTGWPS